MSNSIKLDLMKQIEKDFPTLKAGKIADVNKVSKFLQKKGFKQNASMSAAVDFENYKKGQKEQ